MINMKKIIAIVVLISGYSISRVQGQATSSFNFSATSKPVTGWINVAGDPSIAVRTATDAVTGISISSVATANWVPFNGSSATDAGGMTNGTFFPAAVMQNFWFLNNPYVASYNAAVPQLILSGLDIHSVYTLSMTGSISISQFDVDPTIYTVTGAIVYGNINLNGNFNTANGAVFHNIAPDANGQIRVYLNPIYNVPNESQGALIGGLQITKGATTAPVPIVSISHPLNNDVLLEDGNITINAAASETSGTIVKVEFYANGTKIGESATAPYSMVWVSPDADKYIITARAIDGLGNVNTASVNISVESLSSFWSMTGNIGMNPDSNFVGNVDSVRLAFRTKNLERMSISPTGNIGIGTINPTAQLHTTGTVRFSGLPQDNNQLRVLTSDTSGNLSYRNASTLGLAVGNGLGQSAGTITLGDSIAGPGPYSFNSDRYQYLNGHMYSIGGTVNDPVTTPAFRVYDNGDLAAGATMDRSVSSAGKTGFRYYSKLGLLQLGGSDVIDTTGSRIAYQSQEGSGIVVNTDTPPNLIKGRLFGTYIAGGANTVDSSSLLVQDIIVGSNNDIHNGMGNVLIIGHGMYIASGAYVGNAVVSGLSNVINKPLDVTSLSGFVNTAQDTVSGGLISGALNQFGGLSQLVAGNYLINRTPYGTTLGNSNVDFATQNYTGTRGASGTANIAQYPLFALGNGADNNATWRSNALTVLFNGRTQINTTGHTHGLAQTEVTPKAALEVVSTNSGVLLPKLTTAQRNAIVPADLQNGLLLYNTDSSSFQFYNGSTWKSVGAAGAATSGWGSLGNSGTTPGTNFIGTTDPQRLVFKTNGVENMTILAGGSVGIGTAVLPSSDAKLAVSGIIYAKKIKVTQSGWPDYVFKKGYQLPSLAKVEQYIAKNNHLPGIISAKEVEKKGVDLGDNQAVLLQKVEELTLYLISQNKEIEQLKEENKELEKKTKDIDELKKMVNKLLEHNK